MPPVISIGKVVLQYVRAVLVIESVLNIWSLMTCCDGTGCLLCAERAELKRRLQKVIQDNNALLGIEERG